MPYDRIIDIYWDNDIDLDFANANGVQAVICKATEGVSLPANATDASKYPARKTKAQRLGMLWGAYHLTNGSTPGEQLAHFLTVEDGSDPSVLLAIDWETAKDGTSLDLAGIREFVRLFVNRFNGRFPMLYGGSKIRDNAEALAGDDLLGRCPLWYQQYSKHPGPLPASAAPLHFPIGPWTRYTLWQYSDEHGAIYGAPSFQQLDGADWNRFSGDLAALRTAWPFAVTSPAPTALAAPAARTLPRPATMAPLPANVMAPGAFATPAAEPIGATLVELSEPAKQSFHELSNLSFAARAAAAPRALVGVSEGDSWFDYPPAFLQDPFHGDLLGHLHRTGSFNIYNVAKAGDTLENMVYGTDVAPDEQPKPAELLATLDAVKKHQADFLLLSAGGNDMAGQGGVCLETYLNHATTGLEPLRRNRAAETFSDFNKSAMQYFIDQVKAAKPDIHIFIHGYDYAVPDGRGVIQTPPGFSFIGPWLLPAFARKRVWPVTKRQQVIIDLIDMLNTTIAKLAAANSNVHHIDCRGTLSHDLTTYRQDWANELHPTASGFAKIAQRFSTSILGAFNRPV